VEVVLLCRLISTLILHSALEFLAEGLTYIGLHTGGILALDLGFGNG